MERFYVIFDVNQFNKLNDIELTPKDVAFFDAPDKQEASRLIDDAIGSNYSSMHNYTTSSINEHLELKKKKLVDISDVI